MNYKDLKSRCESLLDRGDEDRCRMLLLSHGYFKGKDVRVQKLFKKCFPPTNELEQELQGSLKELTSTETGVRLKAIKYINSKSRGNWTQKNKLWLADPRTIEILLDTLEDTESRVVRLVINSLGMISERFYFFDARIREALIDHYHSADDKIRLQIAQSIPQFGTDRVWSVILEALTCRPSKTAYETVGLAVARHGRSMSPIYRELFVDQFLGAISTQKNGEAVRVMLKGVVTLGVERAIPDLEELCPDLGTEGLRKQCQNVIRYLNELAGYACVSPFTLTETVQGAFELDCYDFDSHASAFDECGFEGDGLGWEAVARQVVHSHAPHLAESFSFSSIGSRFRASGRDRESLEELATLMRDTFNDKEALTTAIKAADPEWFD